MLVLGGNNPQHAEWIRELGAVLTHAGHSVVLHDYAHWKSGAALADIEAEIQSIAKKMHKKHGFVVVAKSIGTVIASLAIARGMLKPSSCLLLGVPYSGIAGEIQDFLPSLQRLPKTTFIQNEFDPYGGAEGLDALLEVAHPLSYELEVVFDNYTHDYVDYSLVTHSLA